MGTGGSRRRDRVDVECSSSDSQVSSSGCWLSGSPGSTPIRVLLTYFAEDSELREGLEQIDRDGGSSTLDIVVQDPTGERVDAPEIFAGLEALQGSLEADPAVGVVVSPTVLIGHARTLPLASMLPVSMLLDLASSPQLGEVALGFVTAERDQAHYLLRMRESRPESSRDAVMERMRAHVDEAGLAPVLVAGLYDLQAQLGRLIASSLRIGIGGLLMLFLGVAFVVSRSLPTALKMWVCLAAIPTVVLGVFGLLGIAVDIITSPAANVALAIGADSMIHLVVRARRLRGAHDTPWRLAVAQISRPVLGATGIISGRIRDFRALELPTDSALRGRRDSRDRRGRDRGPSRPPQAGPGRGVRSAPRRLTSLPHLRGSARRFLVRCLHTS